MQIKIEMMLDKNSNCLIELDTNVYREFELFKNILETKDIEESLKNIIEDLEFEFSK